MDLDHECRVMDRIGGRVHMGTDPSPGICQMEAMPDLEEICQIQGQFQVT